MNDISLAKAAARKAALAARRRAHDAGAGAAMAAAGHFLAEMPQDVQGLTVSGYLPIRSEIDPMPLMLRLSAQGARLCLPVVQSAGKALVFRAWRPGKPLVSGAFGVEIPAESVAVLPQVLIVPLLAYDAACHRLGYGGGFYDRTIAQLRGGAGCRAIGLAYAAQEVVALPCEVTDMRLDSVVSETGVRRSG